MTEDEKFALYDNRLRHIPFSSSKVDEALLEMMWTHIDHALDRNPLQIREVSSVNGAVREVTALGIIRYYIDSRRCSISAMVMKADGAFHPVGYGLPAIRLFRVRSCAHWWLRIPFQTWAPDCSGIDMIAEPLNRPSCVELDTSRAITRRLIHDRRFLDLISDFEEALSLPSFVRTLIEHEAEKGSCNVDRASEIWFEMTRVAAEISRICGRSDSSR